MERYDIIIIGAGPAGLALGSELSKKHQILIIERNKIGMTSKAWTCERKIVEKAGLGKFISVSFNKAYIKSYKDNKFYVKGKYVSVDDKGLLLHFADNIKKNGSKVIDICRFISITKRTNEEVRIRTNKGVFSCSLLIDCSGVESKLVKKTKLYERIFYFPVYGGIYDIRLKEDEINLFETILKRKPLNYLEYFPVTKKEIVFYTFQYINQKKNASYLKRIHAEHLRKCALKGKLGKRKKEIKGIIPLGMMRKHAIDNVFFFGDTSLIGAPMVGTGFTNILQHYKKFAKHISDKLMKGQLSEKELNYEYSEFEQINRTMQTILGVIFLKVSPKDFDIVVDILETLPNKIVWNLIFLRLTLKQYEIILKKLIEEVGIKRLAKMLPKEDFLFIMKEMGEVIEEITVEEADKLFHKHNKSV